MTTSPSFSTREARLLEIWQSHEHAEFVAKEPLAALATMTDHPHVLLVPTGLGGIGWAGVRHFYEHDFIPHIPEDMRPTLLSITVGHDRVVEESVFEFTHSVEMPWLLPGVRATRQPVRLGVVVVVQFEGEKIAHEHLYYDHAALLAQVGLLSTGPLGIAGRQGASKLLELGRKG